MMFETKSVKNESIKLLFDQMSAKWQLLLKIETKSFLRHDP